MSGRSAPFVRFARNVLVIDAVMVALVLVLSVWRGWASTGQLTLAMFSGACVLLALAMLPGLASSGTSAFESSRSLLSPGAAASYTATQLGANDSNLLPAGITWTLLAAAFVPLAYVAAVATFVL